jgi:putative ABC transport system permease protein
LTMLGIIIGVGAVIAMVSIGAGARAAVEARFNAMGTNNLTVSSGSRMMGGAQSGAGSIPLKLELVQLILDRCPSVALASPVYQTRSQVILENKNWNTLILGVNENFNIIGNWTLDSTYPGRFFEQAEVDSGAMVCVLGADTVTNLFPGTDPIGQIIRVRNVPFTVIGVLKAKGQSGGPGGSRDDIILAPYTTVSKRLIGGGTPTLSSIQVSAVNEESTDSAMTEITELMREYNKLEPGASDNFTVRNMADIAESAADSTNILTVLLGSIASISLLVGGIGIMNIMLVSVSERIREIGIRMAIGAQKIDILVQFLFEAVVLSIVGGILGILLGFGASKLLHFIPMFATITTIVSTGSVLLAFGFSALVGIFFGYYPARKAAHMDPIEALRYE